MSGALLLGGAPWGRSGHQRARRICSGIMGGVFVARGLSVMLQVALVKVTPKGRKRPAAGAS